MIGRKRSARSPSPDDCPELHNARGSERMLPLADWPCRFKSCVDRYAGLARTLAQSQPRAETQNKFRESELSVRGSVAPLLALGPASIISFAGGKRRLAARRNKNEFSLLCSQAKRRMEFARCRGVADGENKQARPGHNGRKRGEMDFFCEQWQQSPRARGRSSGNIKARLARVRRESEGDAREKDASLSTRATSTKHSFVGGARPRAREMEKGAT